MQNSTTASPAKTGKRGIQFNQQLFKKAIAKALDVQPKVVHIGAHYGVMQSDQQSWAHVVFSIYHGCLYASCTCYAHTRGDQGKPVPCYHIAAAALAKRATANIVFEPPDPPEIIDCPNAPMCAPGLCDPSCPTASELTEAAYQHFNHADALLRKPEGADRYSREGWEL